MPGEIKIEPVQPLGDYDRHEALDRTSLLIDMICSYLLYHQFVRADDALLTKVSKAHEILCDVYQSIGLGAIREGTSRQGE